MRAPTRFGAFLEENFKSRIGESQPIKLYERHTTWSDQVGKDYDLYNEVTWRRWTLIGSAMDTLNRPINRSDFGKAGSAAVLLRGTEKMPMLLGPLALFFYRIVGPNPGVGLSLYNMLVPESRARPVREAISESWSELADVEEEKIVANGEKAVDLILGWNLGARDPAMATDRGGPLWDAEGHYGDLVKEGAPDLYSEFFNDRAVQGHP